MFDYTSLFVFMRVNPEELFATQMQAHSPLMRSFTPFTEFESL